MLVTLEKGKEHSSMEGGQTSRMVVFERKGRRLALVSQEPIKKKKKRRKSSKTRRMSIQEKLLKTSGGGKWNYSKWAYWCRKWRNQRFFTGVGAETVVESVC